jgi:hypothetical protein
MSSSPSFNQGFSGINASGIITQPKVLKMPVKKLLTKVEKNGVKWRQVEVFLLLLTF